MYIVHTEHVQYDLMDYITNRLSEQQRKRVEGHLQGCSSCAGEYHQLVGVGSVLQQARQLEPPAAYFTTVLPRVRTRLASHRRSLWEFNADLMKIVLPLAVSAFLLFIIIHFSRDYSSEFAQTEALHEAVSDLNEEEIMQAVEKENMGITAPSSMEIAATNIAEHLPMDSFLKTGVSKQIENGEVAEIDVEGMISSLNPEQVDQVLSGLSERKSL
jgi:hypothetical protein